MITNFEEITEDLTENEKRYLPHVVEIMRGVMNVRQPIKQPDLVVILNSHLEHAHGVHGILNSARLRKYFNHIRSHGLLPLIATSEGCYITDDKETIRKQIESLEQRSRSISSAAAGLKKFL